MPLILTHTPGVRCGVVSYALDPTRAAKLWNVSLDLVRRAAQHATV